MATNDRLLASVTDINCIICTFAFFFMSGGRRDMLAMMIVGMPNGQCFNLKMQMNAFEYFFWVK